MSFALRQIRQVALWVILSLLGQMAWAFDDPLDVPAPADPKMLTSRLVAVAKASESRYVAVGSYGLIIYSDDAGKTWNQGSVPVSADLLAVSFADEQNGWVVGQDAVILHTADGGRTWSKQFDYRQAVLQLKTQAEELTASGHPKAEFVKTEAEIYESAPSLRPLLNVWFEDVNNGYAIGGFNLIFKTDDGGKTWHSWFDRIDNERALHLHAMGRADNGVYIVAEQGLILRLDREKRHFTQVAGQYEGSYFGMTGKPGLLIAFGLRGNAWRTRDSGKTWEKLETPTARLLSAGTYLGDGRLVIVSQFGEILVSRDDGSHFEMTAPEKPMRLFDVAPVGRDGVVLVGDRGLQTMTIR